MIIKCPVCGGEEYRVLYKSNLDKKENYENKVKQFGYASGSKRLGQIVKCKKCSLVYVNPQEEDIERLYEQTEDTTYELSRDSRKITFDKSMDDMDKLKKGWKILDIGCSTGIFLEVAKEKGLDIYGVELSKWGYEKAKKISKNVYNRTLDKCGFKEEFFDVVTMWDLIEHLSNPNKELKEINKILKRDGNLIITTPNINGFFSKLTKRSWWAMIRMHLFYFSPENIAKLLDKNGFRVVKIKSYPRIVIFKYAIEWFKPYKSFYFLLKIMSKLIGNLKLKINVGDTMIVYAVKK